MLWAGRPSAETTLRAATLRQLLPRPDTLLAVVTHNGNALRMSRLLRLPRILLFTDEATARRRGRGVIATIARTLNDIDVAGGVAVVVRHKAGHPSARTLAAALRGICRRAGALIFAHDDAAAVSALDLDGVHLAQASSPRLARLRMPPGRLLGQSVHVGEGVDDVCDYVTVSPVFRPGSKENDRRPGLGVHGLAAFARDHHDGPAIFALGGVDDRNARACIAHGAYGVAVIGAVAAALDPGAALERLRRVVA